MDMQRLFGCACVALWLTACGSDDVDDRSTVSGGQAGRQTPPQGAAALEAWLAEGSYKQWQCERDVHESRAPSPHGFNRICSNDLISAHADDKNAWPNGAAAVKELYEAADAKEPQGYAVYLKTKSDSADGANWYWYERIERGGAAVADGLGDSGAAKQICVSCHLAAGTDASHTPSSGGRDQVYTPVP